MRPLGLLARSPTGGWRSHETIFGMDIRVKTFRAEAGTRMNFLVEDLGFLGPEFDDRSTSYPVVMTLVYHRAPMHVEVSLILSYAGEEYIATSLVVGPADLGSERSEIGTDTAHTGYQMRLALDRQTEALRKKLNAGQ
jgi:hypothetical protein